MYQKKRIGEGDVDPTNLQESLRRLILSVISQKQVLILRGIASGEHFTLTSLLRYISEKEGISISTLKDASRKLKELGLIDYGNSREWKRVKLTEFGEFILKVVGK